jgi:hypothetical protein
MKDLMVQNFSKMEVPWAVCTEKPSYERASGDFIYLLFIQHALSTCWVPSTAVGFGDTAANKPSLLSW